MNVFRAARTLAKVALSSGLALRYFKPVHSSEDMAQARTQNPFKQMINISENTADKLVQSSRLEVEGQMQQELKLPHEQHPPKQQANIEQNQPQTRTQEEIKDQPIQQGSPEKIKVFTEQKQPTIQQYLPKIEDSLSINHAVLPLNAPQMLKKILAMHKITCVQAEGQNDRIFKITNSIGSTKQFNLGDYDSLLDGIYRIQNFLNPPPRISSVAQAKKMLGLLEPDEYLIVTFVPNKTQYEASISPKSYYDTFSSQRSVNLQAVTSEFNEQKYQSPSNKYQFAIVSSPEAAQYLRMNTNKIGDRYYFYRTTPNNGMETSAMLEGHRFSIKSIPYSESKTKSVTATGLYAYINEINADGDMAMFLRSLKYRSENRKILLIYSRERRPEFLRQLKNVALKAAKMMKEDVLVVMTENQSLLPKYFQVVPDDFVTVRLLNTQAYQLPLFSLAGFNLTAKAFYSRRVIEDAFTVQNLCKFIKNGFKQKQYYESKKNLVTIPSIISESQQLLDNTVVLHWKHGCKGCELTLDYLQRIKHLLANCTQELRYRFEIESVEKVRGINFRRLNILNESSDKLEKDHDTTPKLYFFRNGSKTSIDIGAIIGKISQINAQNQEQVHTQIMKELIGQLEKNMAS